MKKLVLFLVFFLISCEVRDMDPYGLNGRWNRNNKELFLIQGRRGKAIGLNGSSIKIELFRDEAGMISIIEKDIGIDYLENFVPRVVAENIYTNQAVKETSFLIRKIEGDRLFIMVHGWQAFYSIENQIYYVVPYIKDEVWTRQSVKTDKGIK